MKHSSLFFRAVVILLLLVQTVSLTVFADELYREETTYSPLSGVQIKTVSTMENGGFFNYQVVTCDLSNPNIALELLYPTEGAGILKPTRSIGEDNDAAVIINADYFNRSDGENKGSAVGYNQKDGQLLSNALEEQVYSFSYKDDHRYSFDFFSKQIKMGFRGEVFEFVKTYNKYSSLEGVAIFDSHWAEESLGSHGTLVELVIEDNILTEIRRDMPPVAIPENGFVLAGLSDLTTLFDQVQVGDAVTLEILTTPELAFLPDFTVGGGSLLVEKGEIVGKMSYPKTSSSFPAIGISEDGKTLWMVTVVNQNGLTLKRMAELLKELGAYYALALDGGGSTQCAVKDNTTGKLQYIHPLSSGYERAVANGLGILPQNNAPKAYGIRVEDTVAFQNIPKQINYTVYNEIGDPMEVKPSKVKFSVQNENGRMENGFYFGETVSTEPLIIEYEDILAECEIKTVAPALYAKKNKDGTYTAINGDGYRLVITAEEFQKSRNVSLVDELPTVDVMTDNLALPKTLNLYGGKPKYQTLWDHLITENVLRKSNRTIYPFQTDRTENDFIEIVTLDNLEGQILNKRMTEWNRFLDTLNTKKQNIIICLEDPVSFSRKQEEELFFSLISRTQHQGKNILVVHRGEKTELKSIKDGVRVLSVAYDMSQPENLFHNPTEFLKIHYSETQMTYEIASEQIFYQK